jgi:hypothetical protein
LTNCERRLMADPHGLILGEVHLEPARDLLGAPPWHPAAITTMGPCSSRSTFARAGPAPYGRPRHRQYRPGAAERSGAADRCPPAWRPWAGGPGARHATAQPMPGSPAGRSWSRHCAAGAQKCVGPCRSVS